MYRLLFRYFLARNARAIHRLNLNPVSRQILQLVDRQLFFEGVLHRLLEGVLPT
jgi:hypothetical protein